MFSIILFLQIFTHLNVELSEITQLPNKYSFVEMRYIVKDLFDEAMLKASHINISCISKANLSRIVSILSSKHANLSKKSMHQLIISLESTTFCDAYCRIFSKNLMHLSDSLESNKLIVQNYLLDTTNNMNYNVFGILSVIYIFFYLLELSCCGNFWNFQ